jgi:membrane glycosyltransferase
VGITVAAAVLGYRLLAADGAMSALDWVLFTLFIVGFGLMAVGSWTPILGALVGRRDRFEAEARSVSLRPTGLSRTALLMPIHAEDPVQVFAALDVMAQDLARQEATDVDIFVLSDTRDPAIAAEEEAQVAAWRRRERPGDPQLVYRRREKNTGRKAGNIADFCARWGDQYDHMVVLDADSIMSAEAIRRLVALMERHPETGIIQSVPYPVNRETLFARILQASARVYSPLGVAGFAAWTQGEGSYWGHNAIVRTRAFRDQCELPVLPGKPPLGGEILCHDIVEAALMRRAGYEVRVVNELNGTFEEMPTNLIDFVSRERRWCEGNLQHARVLGFKGLHWASRFHLGLGVLAYVAAPFGILSLVLTAAQMAAGGGRGGFDLYTVGFFAEGGISALFWLWLFLFIGPRVLSVGGALLDPVRRAGHGGAARMLASLVLEQVFSVFMTAATTLLYLWFCGEVLAGRRSGWGAQSRSDRGVPWGEAARCLLVLAPVGLAWGAVALALDVRLFVWTLPMTLGLLAAVPLAVWTSRLDLGLKAREAGLFLSQDETDPEPVLKALRRRLGGSTVPAIHFPDHLPEPVAGSPALVAVQAWAEDETRAA